MGTKITVDTVFGLYPVSSTSIVDSLEKLSLQDQSEASVRGEHRRWAILWSALLTFHDYCHIFVRVTMTLRVTASKAVLLVTCLCREVSVSLAHLR